MKLAWLGYDSNQYNGHGIHSSATYSRSKMGSQCRSTRQTILILWKMEMLETLTGVNSNHTLMATLI